MDKYINLNYDCVSDQVNKKALANNAYHRGLHNMKFIKACFGLN